MAKLLAAPQKNAVQKELAAQLLNTAGLGDPITFDDVDGLANLPGVLVINRVNSSGEATASKREYIEYSGTSGSTVLITTRDVDSSNGALTHAVGSIVEFIPDVTWADRIYDALATLVDVNDISVINTSLVTNPLSPTSHINSSGATISAILDEDNMASNRANALATQQSIKAYVDSKNVATDAIWDAKGDLAAGTGANTAAVLTVGANDLVLTADSAQATGLKYGGAMANHTTTFGGFSADPAPSTIRYCQIGKVVFVWYTATSNGTSNGTSLTMTLPKAAARTESIHCMGRGVDNAAILTTPLMVKLTATSATATFYKDQSEGTWNGGAVAKSVNFHFAYEVA